MAGLDYDPTGCEVSELRRALAQVGEAVTITDEQLGWEYLRYAKRVIRRCAEQFRQNGQPVTDAGKLADAIEARARDPKSHPFDDMIEENWKLIVLALRQSAPTKLTVT